MKNRKNLDIFRLADDKYIAEADPSARPRAKRLTPVSILAVACSLLLILNIILVIPLFTKDTDTVLPAPVTSQSTLDQVKNPDKGDMLKDNEKILSLMTKLAANYYDFDKTEDEDSEGANDLNELLPPGGSSPDINDNQESGVSEADIIKKSDKFVYYLNSSCLTVFSINGTKSQLECKLPLSGYLSEMEEMYSLIKPSYSYSYGQYQDFIEEVPDSFMPSFSWEMYLSQDYKTLTIIAKSNLQLTGVLTYNVSASPTVKLTDFKIISGTYVSSRMVNEELILFTEYRVYKGFDASSPKTYRPFYVSHGKEEFAQDIFCPSDASLSKYLVVTRMDEGGRGVNESSAYLSYSRLIYVSENNIFLTRQIGSGTEIVAVGYNSPLLQNKGKVRIDGTLLSQYSLDEHEGMLRAVTTTTTSQGTNASLFCISLESMSVISSVLNFAPFGETVRSVRYEGDYAYVCTAIQVTDPVFFFDLSDPQNITYTSTGDIAGFSTSLIDLGNGYVLGIGVGSSTSSSLKIEIYRQEGDGVVSVAVFEKKYTYYSTNYKSYYVNRELNLIGLPVYTYYTSQAPESESGLRYLLLWFQEGTLSFRTVVDYNLGKSSNNLYVTRGFYQDDYFYVVCENSITAFEVGIE